MTLFQYIGAAGLTGLLLAGVIFMGVTTGWRLALGAVTFSLVTTGLIALFAFMLAGATP